MDRKQMVFLLNWVENYIRQDMPMTAIEHLRMVIDELKKEVK